MSSLPPATFLILGALLIPLLRGRVLSAYVLALPVLSFAHLLSLPTGVSHEMSIFDYRLTLVRIDKLSLVWGAIFHIAAFLASLFALHVRDRGQHVAGLLYAGAAIAAVFAGDLVTLFVFWEATAIASVFLIWARRTERSYRAGMRYLIIQVGSGVILLSGILFHVQATGSLVFEHLGTGTLGTNLILIAFGIKCAFPLLHTWLTDAYPEATATGKVYLSAFTTKLAIYALARGYAGTDLLIVLGGVMAAFPLFFAAVENDLRRVLAYCLVNQLGFMVIGVGIGTHLALNGVAAHAFCHILYKSLLFMSMGAVLHRAGTAKGSELGGFVSKSMIVAEAGAGHHTAAWLVLMLASAGVLFVGIRVAYAAFFAPNPDRTGGEEAPKNMLWGMGLTAALCVAAGCYPAALYRILPYADAPYVPYTTAHVMEMLQIAAWAALAFVLLGRARLLPAERRGVVLDVDWTYRRALPAVVRFVARTGSAARERFYEALLGALGGVIESTRRHLGPEGVFARTWTTGVSVLWVAFLLSLFLLINYARP